MKKQEEKFKSKIIDGCRHMICENSEPNGKYWKNRICDNWVRVGDSAVSVVCYKCVSKLIPAPVERKIVEKSDKPKGWKFMKVYVHSDGTVFHKGVEQPSLKGTLPVTVIQPKDKKDKVKLSSKEKESLKMDLAKEIEALKSGMFKEARKTKRASMIKELKGLEKKFSKL